MKYNNDMLVVVCWFSLVGGEWVCWLSELHNHAQLTPEKGWRCRHRALPFAHLQGQGPAGVATGSFLQEGQAWGPCSDTVQCHSVLWLIRTTVDKELLSGLLVSLEARNVLLKTVSTLYLAYPWERMLLASTGSCFHQISSELDWSGFALDSSLT